MEPNFIHATAQDDHTSASPSLNSVPEEVLNLILRALHEERSLAKTLAVCRAWYKIGTPILWRDLALYKHNIGKLLNATRQQPASCFRVRSLTINTSIYEGDAYYGRELFERGLRCLGPTLQSMTNLTTLSITQSSSEDTWDGRQLTDGVVVDLVHHIPPWLEHLEINTPLVYFKTHTRGSCLCDAISAKLNGLLSLRLLWPRICNKLWSKPSTTLQRLTVNACNSDLRPHIQECSFADVNNNMSWDDRQEHASSMSKDAIHLAISKLMEPKLIASYFPKLEEILIIEPHYIQPLSSNQWFLLHAHLLACDTHSDNRLNFQTNSYPIWPTGFLDNDSYEPQFILRRCLHGVDKSPVEPQEPEQLHECSTHDIIGHTSQLIQFLEGRNTWISSNKDTRSPATSKSASSANSPSPNHRLQSKPSFSRQYLRHREQFLQEYTEVHNLTTNPDDSTDPDHYSDTTEYFRTFHATFDVKAKEVGADYVWWLEGQRKTNVLWGLKQEHDVEARIQPLEYEEEMFCSEVEMLERLQANLPVYEESDESDDLF